MAISQFVLATLCLCVAVAGIEAILYRHLFDIAFFDTFNIHYSLAMLGTCFVLLPLGTVIAETLFSELTVAAFRRVTGWVPAADPQTLKAFD